MTCMMTAPRVVTAVVPRLGFRACATTAGLPPPQGPPPPPGPPPPETPMWEKSSGQHRLHRLQSDLGQRRPHSLLPPPPVQRPLNNTRALTDCTENTIVGFGKYRGRSFKDVLHAEPRYCSWVMMEAKRNPTRCSGEFTTFAIYLRGQGTQQQQGSKHLLDERQSEDSFWRRPSNEPMVASMLQERDDETPCVDASADLASGQWKVTFGEQHIGSSFAEVFETDAEYCDFVIGQVLHSTMPPAVWIDSKVLSFVTYVQHMQLRADPSNTLRG